MYIAQVIECLLVRLMLNMKVVWYAIYVTKVLICLLTLSLNKEIIYNYMWSNMNADGNAQQEIKL
jgi:hypothetical protein